MSTLVIQIPPRPHASAHDAGEAGTRAPAAWRYVWSAQGQGVGKSGVAATSLLPKANTVVAVVSALDVSWQRITLPKAPAAKLRQALVGALEESLLEDPEHLHLALAPRAVPGEPGWVAVVDRAWLRLHLEALEAAGLSVERLVPESWPALDGPAALRVHGQSSGARVGLEGDAADGTLGETADTQPLLCLSSGAGCWHWRLSSAGPAPRLRRQLADQGQGAVEWTATPAAAAAMERWLQQQGIPARVQLRSEAEHLLATLASPFNLRQFDLLPQLRGLRALRDGLRRLGGPAMRPMRWGLVALLLVHLVGLNAWAWQQRQALQGQREAMVQLLQSAHPQVRAVLDAPLQMRRETETLRRTAGQPGPSDLENLLAASASAWPAGLPPANSLRYESGQLSLAAPGAGEAQARAMGERLRPLGLEVRFADNRILVQAQAAGGRGGQP